MVVPHPVTITIYDVDGTTLKSGASVLIRNCTKKSTSAVGTTNASGVALLDLANLPLGAGQTNEYETDDECLIIARVNNKYHIGALYVVTGASKTQTLYLKEVPYKILDDVATERLMGMRVSNVNASNSYYAKLWSFDDAELLDFVQVPKEDCKPIVYGGRGIQGRAILEIENKDIMVTANYK